MLMESKTKPTQFRCLEQASIREVRCNIEYWSDAAGLFLCSYRSLVVREPDVDLRK